MNHNQQQHINQPSGACQPPSAAAGPYVVPQPAGYPVNGGDYSQKPVAVETKSRGDGFWKGCAAALCCCCLLDACF
ncbi:cysteine-rich and transmembrane domain-containing protein WIH1-like [Hibiscus syriacus]|uniref:cysteine-rich and transmembrane domain-containing protein WIH1-like n=1 Tax=Hibiscus syriacus TaxID=106335 RepID=UPI001924C2AC|nr:cysteine-rich and transmembrane domain-containing protein WIH1-like [Hibiscus syriacus]